MAPLPPSSMGKDGNGGWAEGLSPRQAEQVAAVAERCPHLKDDGFVRANLHRWLP